MGCHQVNWKTQYKLAKTFCGQNLAKCEIVLVRVDGCQLNTREDNEVEAPGGGPGAVETPGGGDAW